MATKQAANPCEHNELVALFNDARDNIEFLKRQQWQIVNYSILLIGALFGVNTLIGPSESEKYLLCVLGLGACFFGGFFLYRFQLALNGHRQRIGRIKDECFSDPFRHAWNAYARGGKEPDRGRYEIVVPLQVTIIAAWLLFVWVLFFG